MVIITHLKLLTFFILSVTSTCFMGSNGFYLYRIHRHSPHAFYDSKIFIFLKKNGFQFLNIWIFQMFLYSQIFTLAYFQRKVVPTIILVRKLCRQGGNFAWKKSGACIRNEIIIWDLTLMNLFALWEFMIYIYRIIVSSATNIAFQIHF